MSLSQQLEDIDAARAEGRKQGLEEAMLLVVSFKHCDEPDCGSAWCMMVREISSEIKEIKGKAP